MPTPNEPTPAPPTARKPPAKSRKPRQGRTTLPGAPSSTLVRLTGDRLVVRTPGSGERTSAGGLLIPATAMPAPKRLAWGDVTLVGPDVRVARTGDRVLYLPASGLEVELEGEELVLLRERDVQGVAVPGDGKAERPPGQYL